MVDEDPAGDGPVVTTDREQGTADHPSVYRRWRNQVARYRALHITWQITVLTVGTAIICAGLAMLVLPGPGWAAIFVGLAVLSTEFMWAERLLAWTKRQARRAANRALDPRHRRRNQAILALVVVLTAVGIWWYLATYGVPVQIQRALDWF